MCSGRHGPALLGFGEIGLLLNLNGIMDIASAVLIDPEVQGGTPCFAGTRVPVRSLFDAIKRGGRWNIFYRNFRR
jgi:uncharacterized protein (DUF433 family)